VSSLIRRCGRSWLALLPAKDLSRPVRKDEERLCFFEATELFKARLRVLGQGINSYQTTISLIACVVAAVLLRRNGLSLGSMPRQVNHAELRMTKPSRRTRRRAASRTADRCCDRRGEELRILHAVSTIGSRSRRTPTVMGHPDPKRAISAITENSSAGCQRTRAERVTLRF
jgi:hypothetical protein